MQTWAQMAELQPLATRIITGSIKKGRISHAYLLQGERGTGKEAVALLLAKGLFCLDKAGIEPCQECKNCRRIASGNHPDVHWVEPDGESIKKEQVENLQKEFTYTGMESNRKVYVVKDADTLTVNAANRLLKFLEEPKRETTAILMTENSQSIIPTIRSRCQIVDFKPLNPHHFQQHLIEDGMNEIDAALMSAITNNRDEAFRMTQDEWFLQARGLVVQLVEMFNNNHENVYLYIHSHWLPHFKGKEDLEKGLDLLLLALRDVLYMQIGEEKMMVFFKANDKALEQAMMNFSKDRIIHSLNAVLAAKRKLKQNIQPTLTMEQLTLQI